MPDDFQPGGRLPAPGPLRLVQDFVNTEIPDFDRDDLATPAAGAPGGPGRGGAGARGRGGGARVAAGRALRVALRELALANTLGRPPAAHRGAAIDEALGRFPLAVGLVDGVPRLRPDGSGARVGLAAIVAVVAEARAAGSWERLKACRQDTCGWVFYDGSRNRSSSWCSMRVCGGRAKASSYRSRRAGGDAR